MSRPNLFATRITIKNFRGYGDFDLPLPAAPCAVLLSGPNGLGKTSLFEAIEWGLTGSVKRLDLVAGGKTDPRDLARRAEGVKAVEVGLSYCDAAGTEERVQRTQLVPSGTPPSSHGTKIGTVADMLRSDEPRWNVSGQNLADYLHLTHLHAQVASLRLVTFSAKERWVRVSPLAGADRFERVRTNLTSSKAALTKLRDHRAEVLQEAIARRERWTDLLRRLDQLKDLVSTMRDVLAPRDVIQCVDELAKNFALPATSTASDDGQELLKASQAIRRVRIAIERSGAEAGERLDVLGRLRVLPRQVTDIVSQRTGLVTRRLALEEDAARLSRNIEDLGRRTLEYKAAVDEAIRARAVAVTRHERIARVVRDRDDLTRVDQELAEAEQQLKDADQKVEEAGVELRRARDDVATHDKLMAEHQRAQRDLDEVERATAALLEIETLQQRAEMERGRRAMLLDQRAALDTAAEGLSAELATQDENIGAAEHGLDARRKMAAEVQQALSAIAHHITDDDTTCPVCRTSFAHGRLRALARSSLGALDPVLADAESRLSTMRDERARLQSRALGLAQDTRRVAADLRAMDESLMELETRVALLSKVPLIEGGAGTDDVRRRIEHARGERHAEMQRLQRELASKPRADELKKAVSAAGAAVDALTRARSLVHERRLARQTRSDEVRARIAQLSTEYAELGIAGSDLTLLSQAAALDASKTKEASEEASVRLAEASATEASERQTLAALNDELVRTRAQIDTINGSLDGITVQWRAAGLAEPINDASLDAESERIGRRRRELDAALSELSNVSSALERWQQATELQNLEAEVRRQQDALDRDAFTKALDAAVDDARTSAAVAQRARESADELSTTLGKITADFGERALRPFDELFRRYLRALVHDERFHSIEATYEPSARAAALRFRVDLGGSNTDAEYILSEGQLGEVSLAAMLAASTTFPWSRWRALLLDDPTQYNDLIHATALFDVLRNLVRFAGYQIIVSTHDNEQAGFLRRKLDAVRIPWVDCRYIAHGPDGIAAEIHSSDETLLGPVASAS